ncbi:MAG: hypothetical protein CM15mP83_2510 [Flavobacteriaceae bacterium]|nr:MAG: hypothetical protein CM15mP83_2510 [Flavobacteriaceae bacterium]
MNFFLESSDEIIPDGQINANNNQIPKKIADPTDNLDALTSVM